MQEKVIKRAHRSSCHGSVEMNLTRIHEDAGSIPGLTSLSGLRIWRCHELWCSLQTQLDLALLWPWCRLAVIAPIWPLTWEPPYAASAALKKQKQTQQPKKKKTHFTLTSFDISEPLKFFWGWTFWGKQYFKKTYFMIICVMSWRETGRPFKRIW